MSDCPHCRRPANYSRLISLPTDSIYVCPFCERLSRYRIRPATMARAFFWTIFWGSLFLGAMVAGDVFLTGLFALMGIFAILATPYIYGGLTPRFHSQGQAFEAGSRRYRPEFYGWPIVLGLILLGVGSFAGSVAESTVGGSMTRLAGRIVCWMGMVVGVLSLINAGISFAVWRRQAKRLRRRGARRSVGGGD